MQHFILRCKHCQKEYTYCTYGNGPEYGTEEGCSMEYCAECQKAIDNAFSAIPVKFYAERKEIKEPMLLELLSKISEKERQKRKEDAEKNGFFFPTISSGDPDNYDNIETFIHKNKKYQVKWNDKTPDKKHLFIFMEYDARNNKFTGRPWRYDGKDSYSCDRNLMKLFMSSIRKRKAKPIETAPMAMPTGKLFYLDGWNIVQPKQEETIKEKPKPQHVLETRSLEDTGGGIKGRVKYGFYKCKVKVKEGINIKKLIDYVDYKYTYEGYKDEDFVTITKIECV